MNLTVKSGKNVKALFFRCLNIGILSLLTILLGIIFLESIFFVRYGNAIHPLGIIISTLLLGLCIWWIVHFLSLHPTWESICFRFCIFSFPFYFLLLTWFSARLTILPQYDLNIVQEIAALIANGHGPEIWVPYYRNFPNQIPITLILGVVYRIGLHFGITDFYTAGNLFNAGMITIMAAESVALSWRLFGKKGAILTWLLLVPNPIWFLYVSWTSSDTFCLPFAVGGLLCLLWRCKPGKKEGIPLPSWFSAISGVCLLTIATIIRATNIILLIAYLMTVASSHTLKNFLKITLIVLCTSFLTMTAYHGLCDYLGAPAKTEDRFPAAHWIMLGANEASGGEFTQEDYDFTYQISGYKNRKSANLSVIRERVSEMFPFRLLIHGTRKMAETWSSGYCIETTWESVRNPGKVYEYAVGQKSGLIQYLCQAFRLLLYTGLLLLTIHTLRNPAPHLDLFLTALFGAILFYLLWESGQRYSLSFLPWLTIAVSRQKN